MKITEIVTTIICNTLMDPAVLDRSRRRKGAFSRNCGKLPFWTVIKLLLSNIKRTVNAMLDEFFTSLARISGSPSSGSSFPDCGYPQTDVLSEGVKLKKGCRLVLDEMRDDPQPIAPGSQGVFEGYDGVGDLMMKWDSGSTLKLIPSVDKFHVVESDSEIETSIAHEREVQSRIDRDEEFECPRCGRVTPFRTRALSRIADISVCSGCGTMEAVIAAQKGGLKINITGADESTAQDFRRVGLRDWKMVRRWMGENDIS